MHLMVDYVFGLPVMDWARHSQSCSSVLHALLALRGPPRRRWLPRTSWPWIGHGHPVIHLPMFCRGRRRRPSGRGARPRWRRCCGAEGAGATGGGSSAEQRCSDLLNTDGSPVVPRFHPKGGHLPTLILVRAHHNHWHGFESRQLAQPGRAPTLRRRMALTAPLLAHQLREG